MVVVDAYGPVCAAREQNFPRILRHIEVFCIFSNTPAIACKHSEPPQLIQDLSLAGKVFCARATSKSAVPGAKRRRNEETKKPSIEIQSAIRRFP